MEDTGTLILYGYVKASNYRTLIINTLDRTNPKIPTEISGETGIIMNHTSNTLKNLQDNGLIVCLNPSFRKGRLYVLTSVGEKVQKLLNKKQRYVLTSNGIKDTNTNKVYENLEEILILLNE